MPRKKGYKDITLAGEPRKYPRDATARTHKRGGAWCNNCQCEVPKNHKCPKKRMGNFSPIRRGDWPSSD